MTIAARTLIVAVLATTGFSTVGQTAQAASFKHIDQLSLEFRRDSSLLYWEFRRHFRHAAHYNHLISDSAKMYRLADHIHEVAHRGTLGHMADDLAKLDRAFHHLEDLVDDIQDDAYHGQGHTHGNTSHVRELMRELEDTLHHLRDDIRAMRRPVHHHYDNHYGNQYGKKHYQGGGGGITVGNGNFKLKIGF